MLEEASRKAPGSVASTTFEEKRTLLARKIRRWRVVQNAYMPVAVPLHQATDVSLSSKPETVPLFLPSRLSLQQRAQLAPEHGLPSKEFRLRKAQAEDSLATVKRVLRVRLKVYGANLVGQRNGTRARNLLTSLNDKLDTAVRRYRANREAMLCLDGDGDWKGRLQILNNADIVAPVADQEENTRAASSSDPRRKKKPSEGRKVDSWIWKSTVSQEYTDNAASLPLGNGARRPPFSYGHF